jgi:hypothetical protein
MKAPHIISLSIISMSVLFGCSDKAENPQKNEENELITTVHLHLTKEGDSTKIAHAVWKDLSPDDEAGRSIDTLLLDTSSVYQGVIELMDESKNPAIDITKEVEEEKDDHLFIYRQNPLESSIRFSVERTDKDSKNLPVGLQFKLSTRNLQGPSLLLVSLKHQPGTKNGDEGLGDTDLDVKIPVKIR